MLRAAMAPARASKRTFEECFSGLFSLSPVNLRTDRCDCTIEVIVAKHWQRPRLLHVQACDVRFDLETRERRSVSVGRRTRRRLTQCPGSGRQDVLLGLFVQGDGQLIDTLDVAGKRTNERNAMSKAHVAVRGLLSRRSRPWRDFRCVQPCSRASSGPTDERCHGSTRRSRRLRRHRPH
jgi:hypothetical protein